jgi:hypothetical protein
MDTGSDFERHLGRTAQLQTKAERYRVVHLERLPLGTPYGGVVQHVKELMAREPLCGNENRWPAELAIDAGGVGRGVADMFIDAGLKPICVTIVGGLETTCTGFNRWNVPKHELITNLDALLHHDRHPLKSKHLTDP